MTTKNYVSNYYIIEISGKIHDIIDCKEVCNDISVNISLSKRFKGVIISCFELYFYYFQNYNETRMNSILYSSHKYIILPRAFSFHFIFHFNELQA